jgi:hypothetical protein
MLRFCVAAPKKAVAVMLLPPEMAFTKKLARACPAGMVVLVMAVVQLASE